MKLKNFNRLLGIHIRKTPITLPLERAKKRYAWMLEEINEFLEASEKQDIVKQADAMIDTIYFALGTLVEIAIEPDELFYIVQNANMSKLWSDGKQHYNEMGKVIKPKGWEDPHKKLELIIQNMKRR